MADELEEVEIAVPPEGDTAGGGGKAAKGDNKEAPKAADTPPTAPKEEPVVVKTEPEKHVDIEKQDDDPQRAIDELKRKLQGRAEEAERQRLQESQRADQEAAARQAAETRAKEATTAAESARKEAVKRELESVSSALSSVENERTALKAALVEALAKGDFSASADLQSQIGEASGRIVILREGKAQLEHRQQAVVAKQPEPDQPVQRPQAPQLDFSRPWNDQEWQFYLGTRTPKTAQWLREHPEFGSTVSDREKVTGLHAYATQVKRLTPDTDEYFDFIDRELKGEPQPPAKDESKKETKTPPKQVKTPAPAAPPSRTLPEGGNSAASPTVVKLSKDERETARILFPDLPAAEAEVSYARGKLKLINEGRYGSGKA